MIEHIERLDQRLFVFLNEINSPIWDEIMWNISGKLQWLPLYFFLLYLLYRRFGKNLWIVLIGAALLILLSDQISVHFFKDVFKRYRPCHNLELREIVHIVNNKCGGKYGFVSSHAANTFAIATYIFLLLFSRYSYKLLGLFIWAILVSYSRIYLGVHYPADVLFGALLGMLLAYLVFRFIEKVLQKRGSYD